MPRVDSYEHAAALGGCQGTRPDRAAEERHGEGDRRARTRARPGRVLSVDPRTGRVLVEGVQMVKRHTRPNPAKQIKGGIAERESPIAVSNLMMVCPACGPVRIAQRVETSGRQDAGASASAASAARRWTRRG